MKKKKSAMKKIIVCEYSKNGSVILYIAIIYLLFFLLFPHGTLLPLTSSKHNYTYSFKP